MIRRIPWSKFVCSAITLTLWLIAASPAFAEGSLDGHVRNGTSGAPAANVTVVLIQLQGDMQPVATTQSDAQGRFHFDNPSIGKQPMLVRAVYRGVNFHQPLPPGRNTADVEVFEPSTDAKIIAVPSRLIVFQPNGAKLIVGEEYVVQNNSKPPAAFFKEQGSFEFQIPKDAELQQVAAWGPSGMPVVQTAIDRGENRHAIAFAFRPGESGVRLSYQMPYPSNATVVPVVTAYAVERMVVVAPPTVKVDSPGFRPAGTEQGMSLYERDGLAANAPLSVQVSGTAPGPTLQSAQGNSSGSAGAEESGRNGAPERAEGRVETLPSRIDSLKWPVSIGFGMLFALGAIFLWRKSPAASTNEAQKHAAAIAGPSEQGVRVHVENRLDALKESLFRLELRHQAGTISDEDYLRERTRVEGVLREMVRG